MREKHDVARGKERKTMMALAFEQLRLSRNFAAFFERLRREN